MMSGDEGEMRVLLRDGKHGLDERIILAAARMAKAARTKAIRKLRRVIAQLEEMGI